MRIVQVKFTRLHPGAVIPAPAHGYRDDAGADIRSVETRWVEPGETVSISTGLSIELPPGVELQIRTRSGLAFKHQVVVTNSPATIDPGFRGELKVILTNHGKNSFLVGQGDRVAQAVLAPYFAGEWVQSELTGSSRGEGGLGSTGVS